MRILREWIHRLWATLHPTRRDEELAEELRLHMELAAERGERVTGAAQAMEALRDQRGLPWLDDLTRDFGYGVRTLRRSPGFTAAALLSLALGIGANAGIFSLIDQVILRPIGGVREPERIAILGWNGRDMATSWGTGPLMSYPLCRELQEQDRFFEGVFCRFPTTLNFSTGQRHEPVRAELVSGSYFPVLGVRPALGRLFDASDDRQPDGHPVVVLSHAFWHNELGGVPDIVGQRVLINNNPMTVIGVAPASFRGVDLGQAPSLWLPAMMKQQATPEWNRLLDRRAVWLHVFGRLKQDVTAEQAQAGLQPWFTSMLQADTRREDFPAGVPAERMREFLASTIQVDRAPQGHSQLRGALRRPLWVLMGGTVLLLLLASLNVAGLFLARGAARSRELTTRMALGASRGRITRQLLVESLVITMAGGLLGLAAAPLVSHALLSFLGPDADLNAGVDYRVLLFALAASIATGAVCGLAPAFQARRIPLNERTQIALPGGTRFRKVLIVGQIAFTLILLTGAGIFMQTVARLHAKAPASAANVVMFSANAPALGYTPERSRLFMRELLRKLHEVPEVERAAMANTSLLAGGSFTRVLTIQAGERIVTDPMYGLRVTPDFFATLGTRVVAGRAFDERDTLAADAQTGHRSAIVNESFVRKYFGGRNPVGSRLGFGDRPETPTHIEIVGVIEDLSYQSLRLTESEHIFLPFWDVQSEDGAVYAKVRGDPAAAFGPIRAAVAELEPALPMSSLRTFQDQMDQSTRNERMLATLLSGFGVTALIISVVGLYGVMAFVATRRTQEIGVRLALGSTRTLALWLVLREALVMVISGLALAVPAVWALRRLVEAQLFGVGGFDEPTMSVAGGGLAAVALSAAALPAWRAAVLPPMTAIRDQPESMWQSARLKIRQAMHERAEASPLFAAPSATLIGAFTGLVQRAESFPEALQVALPMLRERVGTEFITLLEKRGDEYRGADLAIPSRGVLLNRLTHYPHPLPLTAGELQGWRKWAHEFRPGLVDEVERLAHARVRMAVALRTRHEIVGVLLLGAPEGRSRFGDPERQLLSSAAEVFALMIENARLNDRALEQEKVRRDLALAAEVQRRLLPSQPPSSPAVTLAALTLPARTIGGDFYDFIELGGGRIAIAVADISGKGIAAALLTSAVQVSMRTLSSEGEVAPSQIAAKMNRILYRSSASNSYATFFYAQLEADGRRLRYVNAGHNPPYLVRQTGEGVEIFELTEGGTVLGLFPDLEYDEGEVELRPGDLLVVFTDGVTEARRAGGEEFGEERLQALLRRLAGAPAEHVSAMFADQMRDWTAGAEQHDDLTFVVAAISGSPAGVA